ncbi:uncharacterized protein LOC126267428 [Schistocerca gregaria]|uniref:uncharacterized protein LOC126267428 n=1 Tax=Schistocerca gregaria TaxID=7010 RepID=UPI00211DE625|nr:uncharacterized protein LOC126267428 [Schistocerca gregaria]
MVLLRRSSLFSAVVMAASLSLTWATSQEDASSSTPPRTAEDVSTTGASSGGGADSNDIEDAGARLVVIPFSLTASGRRGVPRMMWSSSPLLHALSPGLTTEPESSVDVEPLSWESPTWSAAALYRDLMERAARARGLEEEASDDATPWSPEELWLAHRDSEAEVGTYDDDGDDEEASSTEEEAAGLKDYDEAEDPAEESMQTAENIVFRPLFRYKAQQASRRRSYTSKSKSSRRKYRPRRRHYPSRKYRPYYNYNYYYPYNYYRQYSPSHV